MNTNMASQKKEMQTEKTKGGNETTRVGERTQSKKDVDVCESRAEKPSLLVWTGRQT